MMGRSYGYGYGDMMGGYGWIGGLLMLLFWGLVIAGIVLLVLWIVRSSSAHGSSDAAPPQPGSPAGHDEAVAIAKRRLASGEITAQEYEQIIRTLGG